MTISIVQSIGNFANSSVSTVSVNITPTAGNLLWIRATCSGTPTFASTNGNTITTIGSLTNGQFQAYIASANAGADTISVSGLTGNPYAIVVTEIGGIANAFLLAYETGAAGTTSGTGPYVNTGPSVGPINTVPAAVLVYAQDWSAGLKLTGPGSGFTAITPTWTTAPTAGQTALEWETFSTGGGSVSPTFAVSGLYDTIRYDVAVFASGTAIPTVTSVNSGSSIQEGATSIAIVGTNFASGMTSAISQPGSVSVAQSTTYNSATSASFNLTMEPGTGDQLAFTDSTYTTNYTVTDTGGTSADFAITLVPPTGNIFQTLTSYNSSSPYVITASGTLAVGDQLEASGNATGTAAVPTGLQLNSDGTWQFASGDTPQDFYVRAYDSTTKTWGSWALQSTSNTGGTSGMMLLGVGS